MDMFVKMKPKGNTFTPRYPPPNPVKGARQPKQVPSTATAAKSGILKQLPSTMVHPKQQVSTHADAPATTTPRPIIAEKKYIWSRPRDNSGKPIAPAAEPRFQKMFPTKGVQLQGIPEHKKMPDPSPTWQESKKRLQGLEREEELRRINAVSVSPRTPASSPERQKLDAAPVKAELTRSNAVREHRPHGKGVAEDHSPLPRFNGKHAGEASTSAASSKTTNKAAMEAHSATAQRVEAMPKPVLEVHPATAPPKNRLTKTMDKMQGWTRSGRKQQLRKLQEEAALYGQFRNPKDAEKMEKLGKEFYGSQLRKVIKHADVAETQHI
jgi:hypothetical protein